MNAGPVVVGPIRTPTGDRILRWLAPSERHRLGSAPTHQQPRLLRGMLAAKLAVRLHEKLRSRSPSPPPLIVKQTAPTGEPSVNIHRDPPETMRVSIAHPGESTYAAVDTTRVGLDVEETRPVPRHLCRYFLSIEEEELLSVMPDSAEAALIGWVVKESVLKWHGSGLSIPPRQATIRRLSVVPDTSTVSGWAQVELFDPPLSGKTVTVRWLQTSRLTGALVAVPGPETRSE